MTKVQLIDGRVVDADITDVEHVGDEGSRRAIAHVGDKTYPVYNSIANGFSGLWVEQISYETLKMLEGVEGFVEGSVEDVPPRSVPSTAAILKTVTRPIEEDGREEE